MSITRDTRPVDPIDQVQRNKLNEVAQALRSTHSTLLEVVKKEYEAQHEIVNGPFAYFQLVMNDPAFQWLRPLSGMMANLDDLLDHKRDLKPADCERIKLEVETLLVQTPENVFALNFKNRETTDNDVKVRHLEILNSLEGLISE